jgi:hypothetical protein
MLATLLTVEIIIEKNPIAQQTIDKICSINFLKDYNTNDISITIINWQETLYIMFPLQFKFSEACIS